MKTILINPQDIDFSDIVKIGRLEIEISPQTDNLNIIMQNFEFSSESISSLMKKLKVLAWAKAVIEAELKQKILYPNGDVVCITGRTTDVCGST